MRKDVGQFLVHPQPELRTYWVEFPYIGMTWADVVVNSEHPFFGGKNDMGLC